MPDLEVTYALKCQWCPKSLTMIHLAELHEETWKAEDNLEKEHLAKLMLEHLKTQHPKYKLPTIDEIKQWIKVLKPFDFPLQFTSKIPGISGTVSQAAVIEPTE